ncbi:hypothetical protein BDW59DRAFT_108837 [Aspergillus cavernicola]|uniref:Uncharacterized protein n=1 Tax=Aspergillus cavernicola TaxID=176166 RepID=A0ABR4I1W0_9EURO
MYYLVGWTRSRVSHALVTGVAASGSSRCPTEKIRVDSTFSSPLHDYRRAWALQLPVSCLILFFSILLLFGKSGVSLVHAGSEFCLILECDGRIVEGSFSVFPLSKRLFFVASSGVVCSLSILIIWLSQSLEAHQMTQLLALRLSSEKTRSN